MTGDQQPGEAVVITTPTDVEIRAERVFDAPRERVFAAFTDTHLETATFEDLGERTKFTTTLVFDTTEERDQLLSYGGEAGMNESYARLDALLARLASG